MTYKVILIGRLTADPEEKTGNSGESFCRMRVAVNSRDRGEETTDFWSVVAFNKTGMNCMRFLEKGRQVYIEGRPSFSTYQAKSGETRIDMSLVAREVTFLSGESGQGQKRQTHQPPMGQTRQAQSPGGWQGGQSNDPIPF